MHDTIPGKDDIVSKVKDNLDGLDKQRLIGLEKMMILQSIKNDALEREKARLSKKYNDAHPRIKKISERLSYNKGLKKELEDEIVKANIKVPEFDINMWMVHGRILNKEGKGIKGCTLSLRDEKGNCIKKMKYDCTDESGYFALKYKVRSDRDSTILKDKKLFLTVTDADLKILHQEKDPLYVKAGKIDFRIIVLDKKGKICTPPREQ